MNKTVKSSYIQRLTEVLVLAFLYYVTGRLGQLMAIPPGNITPVWPPSGLAIAAILLVGYRVWPGIFLGAFFVHLWAFFDQTNIGSIILSLVVGIMVAAGSTLQALAGAFLVRRYIGASNLFEQAGNIFRFVGISVFSCLVSSTIGMTSLCLGRFATWQDYGYTWLTWWLGGLAGVILFVPLLLGWARLPQIKWNKARIAEAVFLTTVLTVLSTVIFNTRIPPGPFISLPVIIVVAFRFGRHGITLAVLVMSVLAIRGAMQGLGPFAAGSLNETLLWLQVFMGVTAITGLSLDAVLTERKNAELALQQAHDELETRVQERTAELARSNTELGQFAYMASHDLQEPLRTVSSYMRLLSRRYKGKLDATADEFIAFVVDATDHMQRMINDLLAFSRLGKQLLDLKPCNCQMILEHVQANLRTVIEKNQAVIACDTLPMIIADEVKLAQLFQNLISNAIKFRSIEPPRIHITARFNSPEPQSKNPESAKPTHKASEHTPLDWIMAVKDNGIGIDPEHFDRIFLIFQRLHSHRKYEGSGIGLAVCKKIVELHGGRIWVESEPGKGSTFYFTLNSSHTENIE